MQLEVKPFNPYLESPSSIELQLPEDMTVEEWATLGRRLCRSDQMMRWWIGDWAAFGERKYGQLKEFAKLNGIDPQTLSNLAWVSRNVETSRRRENLEWSKHAEVAGLSPDEQEKWLSEAEKGEWKRSELRRRVRQSQGKQNALASDGPSMNFPSRACDELLKWLKEQPEEFWDDDMRTVWKGRLNPIVEFWKQL